MKLSFMGLHAGVLSTSGKVTSAFESLPENRCGVEIAAGMKLDLPGIYEWIIEGRGSYIGKYTQSTRATRSYARNVTNLLSNKPYRRGKPKAFRRIHRELAEAYREGRNIWLRLLENVDGADLLRRERELIRERSVLSGKAARITGAEGLCQLPD